MKIVINSIRFNRSLVDGPGVRTVLFMHESITMPMLVSNLLSGYTVDYGMLMLGVLICTIPTVIIFFFFQKSFAEGITGAVK